MPFGAAIDGDGAVRFRLWAPAARRVELCLEAGPGAGAELAMSRDPQGWFERVTSRAGAGSRYRYRIDGELRVPDPASRFQPDGVHEASEVVDPHAFDWPDGGWRGRPWHEAVIYELHVGAFAGSHDGVARRLDHLAALGVTALELMPLAAFPGRRGWGYDGVAPFAPFAPYGRPEALKALVAAAHARGLMVLLDVVYNHFGPEGNYLHACAPQFFTERHHTPWGAALDFEGPGCGPVRAFFVHNALYWLEEYGLDGLRLDAVHAIHDASEPDLLSELAVAVAAGPGARRPVHLVLENDDNEASRLEGSPGARARYRAQWNDDLHHCLHVLLTGERDGYYADYAGDAGRLLARCLAEGFAYQGEPSAHREGAARGEPSAHLPATAFVGFLQNHDQVGNRALGERIGALAPAQALRAASAVLLLAPQVPLLFMGEEMAAATPFLFFCDFGPELARAVTDGRRREFARFERFAGEAGRAAIPDPNDPATFEASCLDWSCLDGARGREHRERLEWYRELLRLRARHVTPRLDGAAGSARWQVNAAGALVVEWTLAHGARLSLTANLAAEPAPIAGLELPAGEVILATPADAAEGTRRGALGPWSVCWRLAAAPAATS